MSTIFSRLMRNHPVLATILLAMVAAVSLAVDNPEVEPNDSKSTATSANSGGLGMAPSDTISGTTTGTGSGGTLDSADYFLITTESAPVGFYQYQLILTSTTPGHALTIRGLSQAAGLINAASDVKMQSALVSGAGFPANSRVLQWYGFGKSERIYIQITGTPATTAPYSLQLVRNAAPVATLSGPIAPGKNVLVRGAGNTNDSDWWIYDGSLNAVATFGNDSPSLLSRVYTPGIYYIAISDYNVATKESSPTDDGFRNGNVLDFADAIVNSGTNTALNMNVKMTGGGGIVTGTGTKTNPFDVVYYCFTVFPNTVTTVPEGEVAVSTEAVFSCNGGEVCFNLHQVGGENPPSTQVSVSLNLTQLGGPPSFQLFDDGAHCDQQAGDRIFGAQFLIPPGINPGPISIPYIIRDGQGRSSERIYTHFNVLPCPNRPANFDCTQAQFIPVVIDGDPIDGYTINGLPDPNAPLCGPSDVTRGVWYKVIGNGHRLTAQTCQSKLPFDTVINVYCGTAGCENLRCVAYGDDECGILSSATWCSEENATYYILVRGKRQSDEGIFKLQIIDGRTDCSNPIQCLPRGACCLPDQCVEVSAFVCAELRGRYLGDGSTCQIGSSRQLYQSTNAFPIAIPDGSTAGITSTISVPNTPNTISNIAVGVTLTHPFVGDLTMDLTFNSQTVTLMNRVGRAGSGTGDSSNLDGEYIFTASPAASDLWSAAALRGDSGIVPPSIYRTSRANDGASPSPDLTLFNGQNFTGLWMLRIRDLATPNTGGLRGWRLLDLTFSPVCSFCPRCPADFNDDGGIDGADVAAFFSVWSNGDPCGDVNGDGGIDGADIATFFHFWSAGGC